MSRIWKKDLPVHLKIYINIWPGIRFTCTFEDLVYIYLYILRLGLWSTYAFEDGMRFSYMYTLKKLEKLLQLRQDLSVHLRTLGNIYLFISNGMGYDLLMHLKNGIRFNYTLVDWVFTIHLWVLCTQLRNWNKTFWYV